MMQTQSLNDFGLQQQISFEEACSLLRKSRSGLYKTMAADPTFPKPVKSGGARSARVYFVASEIAKWQQAKLAERTTNV